MTRILLSMTLICCAALCLGIATGDSPEELGINQLKQTKTLLNGTDEASNNTDEQGKIDEKEIIALRQDSGRSLSAMNIAFSDTQRYDYAQAVKFKSPGLGWKLEKISVLASDGMNSSTNQSMALPFALEIRDENLSLLYHFSDVQLPYFTGKIGERKAIIEIPALIPEGEFYVCFYGYKYLGLAAELENPSGNSYIFNKSEGKIYPARLPAAGDQTVPVNWLIRVAGSYSA